MRAGVATGLFVFCALTAARARGETLLTLDEAVRVARRNHPTVEAQRAQVVAARGRTEQATSALLPSLTGRFSYQPQTPNYVPTPAVQAAITGAVGNVTVLDTNGVPVVVSCRTPGVGPCVATGPLPTSWALQSYWASGIGLSWTMWDWGTSIYALTSARALTEAARAGVTTAERNVVLEVKVAFFGALAADEQVVVGEEAVATFRRHLEQTRGFHQAGLRTGIDVATVESDLARAELVLARAVAGRAGAYARLSTALGGDRGIDWKLVDNQRADESQPDEVRAERPTGALVDVALRQRSEVRQLTLQTLSDERRVKSARGRYLPQLTLDLGPTWGGTDIRSLIGNFQVDVSIGYPAIGVQSVVGAWAGQRGGGAAGVDEGAGAGRSSRDPRGDRRRAGADRGGGGGGARGQGARRGCHATAGAGGGPVYDGDWEYRRALRCAVQLYRRAISAGAGAARSGDCAGAAEACAWGRRLRGAGGGEVVRRGPPRCRRWRASQVECAFGVEQQPRARCGQRFEPRQRAAVILLDKIVGAAVVLPAVVEDVGGLFDRGRG